MRLLQSKRDGLARAIEAIKVKGALGGQIPDYVKKAEDALRMVNTAAGAAAMAELAQDNFIVLRG